MSPRLRARHLHDRLDQGVGGARVDLPEAAAGPGTSRPPARSRDGRPWTTWMPPLPSSTQDGRPACRARARPPAPGLGRDHDGLVAAGGGDRPRPRRARPVMPLDADGLHPGWAIRQASIGSIVVRAVPAQPGVAVAVDRELHPGAPAEARRGRRATSSTTTVAARRRRAAAAARRPLGLEPALGGRRDVLPVAAAAAARAGVRARRLTRSGEALEDLDRVGPQEARRRPR